MEAELVPHRGHPRDYALEMYAGAAAARHQFDLAATACTLFLDEFGAAHPQSGRMALRRAECLAPFDPNRTGVAEEGTKVHFEVAWPAGSFCPLPGLREAYHYGTPILDVSVGAARLVVPIGQTADAVGAAFLDRIHTLGPSVIDAYDVVLPGAAESVHIQGQNQFGLQVTGYGKSAWGTPWPGYLPGFFCRDDAVSPAEEQSDLFGPDGTHYDSAESATLQGPRHFALIRPARLPTDHPVTVVRSYDAASAIYKRVTQIRDQATPENNWVSIDRTPLDHLLITTSDGRSWQLFFDSDRRITGVVPGSGKGAVYFSWRDTLQNDGRVTEVRRSLTPGQQVLYRYEYYDDAEHDGDLREEWATVDGALHKRVEHVIVSDTERQHVDWFGPGPDDFRRTDFAYDPAPNLRHRLAGITAYEDPNPGPGTTAYTTTYTHDVDNPAGSMVITRSPDASSTGPETWSKRQCPATAPSPISWWRPSSIRPTAWNLFADTRTQHCCPSPGSRSATGGAM